MTFEFSAHGSFNFLQAFAEMLGIPDPGNRLLIPESLGEGSIRRVDLGPDFKLMIHRYTFKEDFILRRLAPAEWQDHVSIIFYNMSIPPNMLSNREHSPFYCTRHNHSAVEISSCDLNSEIRFPAGMEIHFTVVGIKPATLSGLLGTSPGPLLQRIASNCSTFLYHEKMTPDVEKTLRQLSDINERHPLSNFYYRIKAQELLYLLFSSLLSREDTRAASVNKADIDALFTIRATVLANLAEPPQLPALARDAGMSETKMKQLFKQVFGDTIYNYYQKARMEEAAFLLRQNGQSVSEIGYRLGFSNLSHFSRLFQKHYGATPKKYAFAG